MKPLWTGLLLLAAATGCGDPTGAMPGRFDAQYAAATVGQSPLPVGVTILDSERILVADTITFNPDGTALRNTVSRIKELKAPFRDTRFVLTTPYTYEVDGKMLTLTVVCGPTVNCTDPVSGEITADQLELPSSVLGLDIGRLLMDRIR